MPGNGFVGGEVHARWIAVLDLLPPQLTRGSEGCARVSNAHLEAGQSLLERRPSLWPAHGSCTWRSAGRHRSDGFAACNESSEEASSLAITQSHTHDCADAPRRSSFLMNHVQEWLIPMTKLEQRGGGWHARDGSRREASPTVRGSSAGAAPRLKRSDPWARPTLASAESNEDVGHCLQAQWHLCLGHQLG
jgi:hypothetical protein